MLVHMYDCDSTGFPNLALRKLSTFHKAKGDDVIWNMPLFAGEKNYSSRVFSWSPKPPPGDYERGGWADSTESLTDEIESLCPDYEGLNFSFGFLSRGCIRKCSFCVVPIKEGAIRAAAKPESFVKHKMAVFMDNNFTASPRFGEDVDWLVKNNIICDFNQGLDARLVDATMAKHLARLKWGGGKPGSGSSSYIRFACDGPAQIKPFQRAVGHLRDAGYNGRVFVYVLITEDIPEAYERLNAIYDTEPEYQSDKAPRIVPYGMPFRDLETGEVLPVTRSLQSLIQTIKMGHVRPSGNKPHGITKEEWMLKNEPELAETLGIN